MLLKLLCIALCLIELPEVAASSSGAPPGACDTITPRGHSGGQNGQPIGFSVSAQPSFTPGEMVTITLAGSTTYKGFLMQVRNGANEASGTLSAPTSAQSLFRAVACPQASRESTITHNSPLDKSQSTFFWTAPSRCESPTYTIRAAVVVQFFTYQTGLTATMDCVSNPTPPPTEVVEATTVNIDDESMCLFGNDTMVPSGKYDTSFEADEFGAYNGWRDIGSTLDNGFSWTRQRGRTPSSRTGPRRAEDGDFYLFAEASTPRQNDDKAMLVTDEDLRGCYCVGFRVHQRIDPQGAALKVFALSTNGTTPIQLALYNSSQRRPDWRRIRRQVDFPEMSQVVFEYTRRRTFRGDIAIDDITIRPGSCDDDDDDTDDTDTDDDTDDER